jgi:transmembrane sensor
VLLAGDVGRVTPNEATTVTHGVHADRIMGWTRGEISFETVPLSEVAAELERLYDLDIAFADPSLAQRRVSITFSKESETTVLQLITLAVDAKYTRQGRAVVLSVR